MELLNRLQKVRNTGQSKWLACCPAHEDRSPSLSIKDTGSRLLVHCFAGCTAGDVVAAVGMELDDLIFDEQDKWRYRIEQERKRKLEQAMDDKILLHVAKAAIEKGEDIKESDKRLIMDAKRRLQAWT